MRLALHFKQDLPVKDVHHPAIFRCAHQAGEQAAAFCNHVAFLQPVACTACLLYTSDAADDLLCVDLGGRSIIKKKIEKEMKNLDQTHPTKQPY